MIDNLDNNLLHHITHSIDEESWKNIASCNSLLTDSIIRTCHGCGGCTRRFRAILRHSCKMGNLRLAGKLIARAGRKHVLADDGGGNIVLMSACNGSIVELLLRHSPEEQVRAQTSNGWSALMFAARRGDLEVVHSAVH